MSSEQMKILEMLSEGKLSVDEATQLLESLQTQTNDGLEPFAYPTDDAQATPSFIGWLRDIFKAFGPKEKFTETISQEFDSNDVSAIAVQSSNGKIAFTGREQQGIDIQAHKTVKAPTQEEAEAFAAHVEIESEVKNGILRVYKSHPKPPPGYGVSVAYDITGPKALALTLSTSNGKIEAEQVNGPVKAVSSNGKIHLTDVTGQIEARTSNGSIDADMKMLKNESHFTTSNGAIQIRVQQGVAPITAKTSNGSIKLHLPADFAGQVDAKTVNGSVTTDFETTTTEKTQHRLVGQIGANGDTSLKLRTSNGSIRFSKIAPIVAVEVS